MPKVLKFKLAWYLTTEPLSQRMRNVAINCGETLRFGCRVLASARARNTIKFSTLRSSKFYTVVLIDHTFAIIILCLSTV
mgnify:CR=1 FL=1